MKEVKDNKGQNTSKKTWVFYGIVTILIVILLNGLVF